MTGSLSVLLASLRLLCRSILLTADFTIYGHSLLLPDSLPDHFLPALPLAAACSVGTHVNSGIG